MFRIPLVRPYIDSVVRRRVLAVLDSGHLTEGPVTAEMESAVSAFTGARHCIATTSCTTGLELALRACGIGQGDEVILPAFTYPATAHAVVIVGATPVFVDVDRQTMLIDYARIKDAISNKTRAILPVSLFGNPLDYDRLNQIKYNKKLRIIEDAACALGARFQGAPTGKHADLTIFSLHPRKFITSGEGGLVTTDDTKLANWMRSYKRFGIAPGKKNIVFKSVGTNYKLSDILAAVGLSQMRQIEKLMIRRRKQVDYYHTLINEMSGVTLPITTPQGEHSYQSFCIFIHQRDRVLRQLRAKGVEVQIGSYCLPDQPAYENSHNCKIIGDLKGSRWAYKHSLALPLYHQLKKDEQRMVVSALFSALADLR